MAIGSKYNMALMACAALLAGCALIWLTMLFTYSINADNAVLTEFARRMLAGGSYGIDYIDTNPPYNIFLYVPVVLLSYIGIPVYHGIIIFTLALLALSCWLSWRILKAFEFISQEERIVFLGAFVLSAIAMGHIAFGERDQMTLLARAHSDAEVKHLLEHGADGAVMAERELAYSLAEMVMSTPPYRALRRA